jgi:hypothetical protein
VARRVPPKTGGTAQAAKASRAPAARKTRRKPTTAQAAKASGAPAAEPVQVIHLAPESVSLNTEVREFRSTADTIAIGDLAIRKNFADRVMILFVIANVVVLIGLGVIFALDCIQLADHLTKPADRIVDGKVIMALLGATTVQLGTVIYTITRAIFPTPGARQPAV